MFGSFWVRVLFSYVNKKNFKLYKTLGMKNVSNGCFDNVTVKIIML